MSNIPLEYVLCVRVATSKDKVYKEESIFSFDNPESETGLYVCLKSFLGVGKRNLEMFSRVYKSNLFLNIRRHRIKDDEDVTPTRLAIGVPGGFQTEKQLFEFKEEFCIVFFDGQEHKYQMDDSSLPTNITLSAKSIMESESCLLKMMLADNGNVGWTGEVRGESSYSENLKQVNNGKKIPPSGWKCDMCDLNTNLWLNLSDGSILCGRKYFDGSGGNNHAAEYYEQTKFPLAVKLGTIGEGSSPDVFSYPENDMVIDSKIDEHLAFWGINSLAMKKSEKSILEMEIDLNKRSSNTWASSRILESDSDLKFLSGKGLTPLYNIGSSCYMNSVLQVLFSMKCFQERYFDVYNEIVQEYQEFPVDNLDIQLAKMADGLLSGLYSNSHYESQTGLRPYMLKRVLTKEHQDFCTMRQQDAAEFFLYCMQQIKRDCFVVANNQNSDCIKRRMDPTIPILFALEERSEYVASKKCRYDTLKEFSIQLPIDVDRLTLNKLEVMANQDEFDFLKRQGIQTFTAEISILVTDEPIT